jgi:amino acid adenylation domain-containing protein
MQTETAAGFPLSPQQEQLWLEQEDDPAYRASATVALEGRLDAASLRGALEKVVARHEILRTTFRRQLGLKLPFQVIREQLPPSWTEVDLSEQDEDAPAKLAALLEAERRRPFDFELGPLVRASLFGLGSERHVLSLSLPCLVADAAAVDNLIEEAIHIYAGTAGDLAEEPLQYADFAAWARDVLAPSDDDAPAVESAAAGRAFWRDRPAFPVPSLPLEARSARGGGFDEASVPINLDPGALAKLAALSAAYQPGDDALGLFAVFQVLVARLVGQPAITLHWLCDGRTQEEATGALGLYARALPIPVNLEDNPRFAGVLKQTARLLEDAIRWKDYLSAPSGSSPGVVFECREIFAAKQARGVTFSPVDASCHLGPFRAKLSVARASGAFRARLHYDRRFFRAEEIGRFALTFARLVESAAADGGAEVEVERLAILTDQDARILASINQTEAPYPQTACLHDLFEEQVERTPDRPALAFGDLRLSYAELNARANQLAHLLRKRGVAADTRVGLCVERSAEMIVGLLGILKAGGAYVPLLPDHPRARLAHQLNEVEAPVLVTLEKHRENLPAFAGHVLCLDRDRALLDAEEKGNPERCTGPDNLAYVIYTSGSTGLPKGVGVCHRNLVNYTHALCSRLMLSSEKEGQSFATVSTIAADLGNTCVFPALVSGGCLHVIGHELSMDGSLFSDYCAKNPIDVLKITPSHLHALLASGHGVLPRRTLITGGEASTWELCQRIQAAGRCLHINHYGPTETTIGSLTYGPVTEVDPAMAFARTVPIGRPLANTEIHIVDRHLAPVPVGAPGELLIGGAGLSRGYLRQPEQTAERFIPNPFSTDPTARLYRTGDRARLLPDGNVEFLGRIDHQVKIRGFRVELAEIEGVLRKDKAIRQAVVVVWEGAAGDGQLVAYVESANKPAPRAEELRAFLQKELPEYMIPAMFIRLDALPLTPNGKVDRKALPAPDQARSLESSFLAPRNPIEEQLAGIWVDVLRVERVGVNDNFFELGGHSLLATQVISRVLQAFNLKLTLTSFFDGPTVGAMANALESLMLAEIEDISEEDAQRRLASEEQA